jgi:hypothetical protein
MNFIFVFYLLPVADTYLKFLRIPEDIKNKHEILIITEIIEGIIIDFKILHYKYILAS